jgi:hypothetical protein
MDSDRFDRLEALLSAKLDAQTQQVAELQKEVALLRTAVQANAGASTAPIMQQAAAQLAPPLRSSKSSKASSSDAFLSTALKRSFPMFVLPIKTLLSPSFQMFRPHEELRDAGALVEWQQGGRWFLCRTPGCVTGTRTARLWRSFLLTRLRARWTIW